LKPTALDERVHEPPAVLTHKFPPLGDTGFHAIAGESAESAVVEPLEFDAVTATYSV
jgi:hypothetical protein